MTRESLKCLKPVVLSEIINFSSEKDGFFRFYKFVVWISVGMGIVKVLTVLLLLSILLIGPVL